MSSETGAEATPPGHERHGDALFMIDGKGHRIPVSLVPVEEKLEDELVRELIASAEGMNEQLKAFKAKAFVAVDTFLQILATEHNLTVGGTKGNITLQTVDRLLKVQVAVQDRLTFGPKLQIAKAIIDELALKWGETAPELYAMAGQAFNVDKEGKVNASALFGLLRLSIDNDRWREAMAALRESMKREGSARYIRFYWRNKVEDRFESITLDLATA